MLFYDTEHTDGEITVKTALIVSFLHGVNSKYKNSQGQNADLTLLVHLFAF